MKKLIFTLLYSLTASLLIHAQTIAFPGAEGFGRFAMGARAGTPSIYHVTNTNDSGIGSLRDAISQPNRFIVFDVSGIIKISSRLVFSKNLTIAGQTAPGDGITVYGNGVSFSAADNIIVRYMRFRMGSGGELGKDAAGIANGSNMIFDHVSVSWGLDENFSINWDGKGTEPTNITIQRSIIGQGLMVHSAGGLIQTNGGITLYKNLYIDNKTRNPKVKGLNQYSNNIVYNWGSGGGYILGGESDGPSWGVIENNYFIKGPSTGGTDAFVRGNANFQAYNNNNLLDYNTDGTLNGSTASDSVLGPVTIVDSYSSFSNAPGTHPHLNQLLSPTELYNWSVDSVGACIPARDDVDNIMLSELTSLGKTGTLINSEADLGLINGVGNVFKAVKQLDTDNDGIPDSWEDAHGLNKNDASDALKLNADGYLNIEHYINSIRSGIPYLKYPTALAVKAIGTDYITLKWNNNAESYKSICIEQSTDNVNFTKIATVDSGSVDYKISGLPQTTTFYYRLKVTNDTLSSMYSDILKVKTLGMASAPIACTSPTPLNQSIISSFTQTTLSWTNLTGNWGGVLHYDVFAGTSPDSLVMIADSIVGVSCTLNIHPTTQYFWRVDAINYFGIQQGDVWTFTSGIQPDREKVAYWPMNETEGNSATNEIYGMATAQNFAPAWGAGVIANAATITSSPSNSAFIQNHYDALSLGAESFSVELWFKSSGGAVDWYLINKGSFTQNTTTGTTGKWFGIQYNKTGSNDRLTWAIDDNITKTYIDIKPGSAYFNNTWNHIVGVRDVTADKLYVYVNGVLKGTTTDNTGNIAQTENIVIGNTTNLTNAFGGSIDEVSIYKGALTAEEVLNHYQMGVKTSVHNPTNIENAYVFPNPFTDHFSIQLPTEWNGKTRVEIIAMTGQKLITSEGMTVNNQFDILDVSPLPKGTYICKAYNTKNELITFKIFK